MWEAGLLDEVRAPGRRGPAEGRTAARALGYRQVLAQLAGRLSEAEAGEDDHGATRRFARRQDSWFHRDDRIHWLDHADPDRVDRHTGSARPAS